MIRDLSTVPDQNGARCVWVFPLFIMLLLITVNASAGWEIECVGCAPWFEDGFPNHALWAGANGQRLLANGGDGLYLMRDDGAGWTFETVSAAVAKGVSIAVNEAGQIWIAFDDRGTGHIHLAEFTDNTWTFHQNSFLDSAGEDPFVRFDHSGRLCMASFVYGSGLRYSILDGTWTMETVLLGDSGVNPYLWFDHAGQPHICYYTGFSGFFHIYNQGAGWTVETLSSSTGPRVIMTGMAETGLGELCVGSLIDLSYPGSNRASQVVYHYEKSNGQWQRQEIHRYGDEYVEGNRGLGFGIDSGGKPHYAYCRTEMGYVFHSFRQSSAWVIETVARMGRGTRHVSMAWDPAGNPVISFLSGSGQEMSVAVKDGAQWRIETIYGARSLDQHSFCVGPDGTAHLAAKEFPAKALFYGRNTGAGWTFERAPAVPGRVTGIAADSAGVPYIAYQEYTGEDRISLARREPSGWIIEDLDYGITYDVGVGVDDSGKVTVGYSGNHDVLKVITGHPGQGDWQITPLTTTGSLFDLQVIPSGETFFCYRDPLEWMTVIDRWDGQTWSRIIPPAAMNSGTFNTAYFRNGDTYAYCTAPFEDHVERYVYSLGSWSDAETVIPSGIAAEEMDSAVSADGREHLAVQESYHNLMYCLRNPAGGWELQTLADLLDNQDDPHIALDEWGDPHISFLDWWRRDVKSAS